MTDDPTQRHDLSPDPTPAVPPTVPAVTPVVPPTVDGPTDQYSPMPDVRPDWARTTDGEVPPTPERWYEPAPVASVAAVALSQ